uniref:Uncharacterized protein n=1 Tax=Mycena chlorophos TaxID=658473 RepID=A0ABQ0LQX2_MYCCL|nr:predicted protein [Mycena chlorophos]
MFERSSSSREGRAEMTWQNEHSDASLRRLAEAAAKAHCSTWRMSPSRRDQPVHAEGSQRAGIAASTLHCPKAVVSVQATAKRRRGGTTAIPENSA